MTSSTASPGVTSPRLERPRDGRMIAGVAAGIARHLNVDPILVRLGFIVAVFAGGFGVIAYVVALLLIPEEGHERAIVHTLGSARAGVVAGVVLLVIGGLVALDGVTHGHVAHDLFWAVVLLGAGGWLLLRADTRDRDRDTGPVPPEAPTVETTAVAPPPPRRRSRTATRVVLGGLLIAAGALAAISAAGVAIGWQEGIGIAIVAAGAVIVAGAFFGASPWLVAIPLTVAAATGALAAAGAALDGPIGERSFSPAASAELPKEYRVAIGSLDVDLRDTAFAEGVTRLKVHVGIGETVVRVPGDVTLRVDAHAGAGEVRLPGGRADGTDVDRSETITAPGRPVLELDAEVGLGELRVEREGR